MTLKDLWYTLQHILRDKKIELTVDQLNRYLDFATQELMNSAYGKTGEQHGYETEQQITDDFLPLKTIATIPITIGVGTIPDDYWHKSKMELTTSGIEIEFVTAKECVRRRNNTITQPTTTYPIVELRDGEFTVYPTTITGNVTLTYLKKTTPSIVLKTENDIQVYDSAGSTELPWSTVDKYMDTIRIILGYLNIPMSNEQILAYTEQKVNENN